MKDSLCLQKPFCGFLLLTLLVYVLSGVFSFELSAQITHNTRKADLICQDEPMPSVLKKIEKICGRKVLFNNNEGQQFKVSVNVKQKTVDEVMKAITSSFPLSYEISAHNITVTLKTLPLQQSSITGMVKDESGAPLPGVNVYTDIPTIGGTTDADGRFNINIPSGKKVKTVNFSFIGMKKVTVPYTGKPLNVFMKDDVNTIDEVVINGIYERKKESFTGAATVIQKEELMRNGSQNLLQNLKNIDPSFRIVENMDLGSDPNTMPELQIRGQQSMVDINGNYSGNPNQPLFILDGFETDLTSVYDLDMNRVETVVLLKDAAAKAIYGSKAANGVVVIETRKPEAGKLKVTYKGDLNLTVPDLTGYNLCNAREKYDVDKTFGIYGDEWFKEQYLNNIMKSIVRGVDTDWLAQPLRTGIGHRHSVYLEGGDQRIRYGIDLLYNDVKGVMKGSDRKTFSGGFTFSYRYKNLLFRNQFSASLNHADNSPYGEFSEYVVLNPYWTPYDETGALKQIAGSTGGGGLIGQVKGNPLWNAQIGTKNFSKYTRWRN